MDVEVESVIKAKSLKQEKLAKNYALILAGGVGSRVGVGVPKQFVEILGKPILAYTIEAYQNHPDIEGIEVVCVLLMCFQLIG